MSKSHNLAEIAAGAQPTKAEIRALERAFENIAKSLRDAVNHPDATERAAPKESARLALEALKAFRKLYIEAEAIKENQLVADWIEAYAYAAKDPGTFLERFRPEVDKQWQSWHVLAARADRLGSMDVAFFILEGSRQAFVVADEDAGYGVRLDALLFAGTATGYVARFAGEGSAFAAKVKKAAHEIVSETARNASGSRKKVKAVAEDARQHFNEWKAGEHSYRSNAAFARAACRMFGLDSPESLARKVGAWEKERLAARGRS